MIDPLQSYAGYLLRRASAFAMAQLARQLKALALSPAEATVLHVIEVNPNAKQADIGRLLDIARANMAPIVSRLVRRELVERQPPNRRSHGLVLTREGLRLSGRIKRVFATHEAELLAKIPPAHRSGFLTGVAALIKRVPK
jgi:DNA-binding MarR family transcriptional regulator